MPELPEVETVRLQLLSKIKNKQIKNVQVLNEKTVRSNNNFSKKLKGKIFADIDRVGKLMIFSFKNEADLFLLAHLKMTGQFFFVDKKQNVSGGGGHSMTDADQSDLPNKHTRVAFYFTDASSLFFNDMRKFGYIELANTEWVKKTKARFGPEPITVGFDNIAFATKLKNKNRGIKAVLLDQTFIAGLGNIYVDEALFVAKINPERKANTITQKEAFAIAKASGAVMNKAISVGGTTFQHFKDTGGKNGNYTDYLKVFGKHKTPCSRCKTTILKIRVAGRGTHYCPNCQK
ncbi:MAG TPA: DNA-formamidopyrimidine glycosylase [Candidatus Paceibacterota bacterium]|nr:DNA-formamidopyrimidine glycosylase [Candidatus Paceibacterota bacterium]HMO83043.1 DNA-formamidopyrimidine glycosylase [Candidatus Paceibacterota bacterium]